MAKSGLAYETKWSHKVVGRTEPKLKKSIRKIGSVRFFTVSIFFNKKIE